MKITFTDDDGMVLDEINIVATARPDPEDILDDNIYLDERESVLEMVEQSLKYIYRKQESHSTAIGIPYDESRHFESGDNY